MGGAIAAGNAIGLFIAFLCIISETESIRYGGIGMIAMLVLVNAGVALLIRDND